MKKFIILSLALSPLFAMAQQGGQEPSASEVFNHMDSNGDNYVSESEMSEAHEERMSRQGGQGGQGGQQSGSNDMFSQSDANGDGVLSYSEFETMHNNRPQRQQRN